MAEKSILKPVNIPLSGKLVTAIDGSSLAEGDFQILKNMRYGDITPKSITGMTKINTSVINADYLKPRAGFHFRKSQPAESHVLVQALKADATSKVYENTTAIPNAGGFTATQIWSDTVGALTGEFSNAPDGCVTYANGKDTCVWGGSEYRCAGFIVGNPDNTIKYDYTDKINNTLSDSLNVATMVTVSGSIDANTMLLLHMDGADTSTTFTDSSPTTPHTVTAWGNAQIDTAFYKFETGAGLFDGTDDYLSIPDNPDFDFSGGIWTIDFWIRGNWSGTGTDTIYWQRTTGDDLHYFAITIERTTGANDIKLEIKNTTVVVSLTTTGGVLTNTTWQHVEVVENGNDFYIFVDGNLKAQTSDTDRAENYGDPVYIGTYSKVAGSGNYFKGHLDEFRVSNVARHTVIFNPPVGEYGTESVCYLYLASTRPIKGVKFYISHPNATAATVAASYWANSAWTPVTNIDDQTALVAGKTLSLATGTGGWINFDSTVATAKPRIINNVYAYWYLFVFTGIDNDTSIYHAMVDAPFQQIVDLWDGNDRSCLSYMKYISAAYTDETYNVLVQDYVSGAVLTYSDISSLATSSYLICGFAERMTGIGFSIVTGKANSNVCIMTVSYWNGTAWTSVGTIDDGTRTVGTSFSKSGSVTWDAPIESSEFKNSISSGDLWHYYKISFNATLSANVYLDYVTGIPAQKVITGYSWPVSWGNRVWLLDETSNKRNSALCSSQDTIVVFNGSDSTTLYFGNEEPLMCGAILFTRFGSNIYDNLIILKKDEAWLVDGTVPDDYKKYKIGDNTGCVAPKTLRSCDMGYEIAPGLTKHVLIWQAENAVVIFDGNVISPISGDIANYFDRTKSECIPDAMKGSSTSFYDESRYEYHWCFASGVGATTLNKEFVYSLLKRKWFEVDRGTGKYLQIGFSVKDTNGNNFNYGGIDTGFIERLEYGTTFDTNSIISQFKTLDIPFGGYNVETAIRHIRLIAVAKTTTTNTVAVTHFGDGINTSSSAPITLAVRNTTNRFVRSTQSVNWGNFLFHSFLFSLTTINENVGMEPVGLGIMWEQIRESVL